MSNVLYIKHRPRTLKDVVGQDEAVSKLQDMGRRKDMPHAMLFTGPSGCGKTTIARIIADKLGCSGTDFFELNAAKERGIDMVRSITKTMGAAPLGGKCRVWLIDEAHALTADAQGALLKPLEDTPPQAYIFLATTDPQKLKKTIHTRCTEIRCRSLSEGDLRDLSADVASKEEVEIDDEVLERIAKVSDGSARKVLVLLHSIIGMGTPEEQLKAIDAADIQGQAFELCRKLMRGTVSWPEVAGLLKNLDEEAESIRHMVLGYCRKVLLGKGDHARAALIIEEFREPMYDKGATLTLACYNVVNGG